MTPEESLGGGEESPRPPEQRERGTDQRTTQVRASAEAAAGRTTRRTRQARKPVMRDYPPRQALDDRYLKALGLTNC